MIPHEYLPVLRWAAILFVLLAVAFGHIAFNRRTPERVSQWSAVALLVSLFGLSIVLVCGFFTR